jgi:hypothetical protein
MKDTRLEDKKIPHLTQCLDPEAMAGAFEDFFSQEYPDRGLKVKKCHISQIYHKPGKNCRMNFHLLGEDRENRPFEHLFYSIVYANTRDCRSNAEHIPGSWPGCGVWKPVSRWPEMNMQLYAFPYDSRLPYLGQLLEPGYIKHRVEKSLDGFGLSSGWRCEEVIIHRVKYRHGKNCTLRYEATLADAANPAKAGRRFELYGKTYNCAQSRYVYEAIKKLCASPACTDGRLNIPAPIVHLDEANTLWQFAWEGTSFSRVGRELGWAVLPNFGYVPRIASMLAALHQVERSDLQLVSGPSPAIVIGNARGDLSDIAQFFSEKQAALKEISKTLDALASGLEVDTPQTLIHGSFKITQILCRDEELGLVDFDSIACGDPLYDVAEFIASLAYLTVRDRIPAASISASVDLFLTNYRQHVPWDCDRRRLAWYVVAFLLSKIHSSLKGREISAIDNMPIAFDRIEEWLELARGGSDERWSFSTNPKSEERE